MEAFETTLPDVVLFELRRIEDSRGFFVATFQAGRELLPAFHTSLG